MRNQEDSRQFRNRPFKKKQKRYQCFCGRIYRVQSSFVLHVNTAHKGMDFQKVRVSDQISKPKPKDFHFNSKSSEQELLIERDPLMKLAVLNEDFQIQFSKITQMYKQEPVFNKLTRFINDTNKPEINYIVQDRINEVKMGVGLGILIRQLRQKLIDKKIIQQCILMLTLYVSTIIQETQDQSILTNGTIYLFPQYINLFMKLELKPKIQKLNFKDLWIGKTQNIIFFFKIIFQWLLFKLFIKGKMQQNQKGQNQIIQNQ